MQATARSCPSCDRPLEDGWTFCHNCGQRVRSRPVRRTVYHEGSGAPYRAVSPRAKVWDEPPPQKRNRRRAVGRSLWVVVGLGMIIAVVVLMVIGLQWLGGLERTLAGVVLIPAGTRYSLAADNYQYNEFQLNSSAHITGKYSATSNISAFLMNPGEFQDLQYGGGYPTNYAWTSGSLMHGGLGKTLGPGTWYLVFFNNSTTSAATVRITTNVVAVF